MTKTPTIRATTKRIGFNGARGGDYCYKGVLKTDKGEIVWACEHEHSNRDDNQYLRPPLSYNEFPQMRSALNCARVELKRNAEQPV